MAKYLRCYRDFSGGLSEVANDNMADNQLARAVNIVPGEGFGICRSFGTETALPRLGGDEDIRQLSALVRLTPADGTAQLLAFSESDGGTFCLSRYDEAGERWLSLEDGLLAVRDWFLHAHCLYWLDGSSIYCYDGETVEALSRPEGMNSGVWDRLRGARAVVQRGQRWFYATDQNEVLFSGVGEPFQIADTACINVNTKNDDGITALHEFDGGVLIFKRYSVHYLSGWDLDNGSDIQLRQLTVTCGTRWAKTVATLENGVYYLGENGLYRLYVPGNSVTVAAENISEHRISRALFAEDGLREAFAAVWDNTYFLTVLGNRGDSLYREYRYYPQLKAFFGEYT